MLIESRKLAVLVQPVQGCIDQIAEIGITLRNAEAKGLLFGQGKCNRHPWHLATNGGQIGAIGQQSSGLFCLSRKAAGGKCE